MGVLLGIASTGCMTSASTTPDLLVTDQTLTAMEAKVRDHDWARSIRDSIVRQSTEWLEREIDPPVGGGGWYHNYVCPVDAGFLDYEKSRPDQHWCPRCETFYEGDKLDAAWVNNTHMQFSNAVHGLGLAYHLTGDQRFADFCSSTLSWYAARYSAYPVHGEWAGQGKVTGQSLDEAMWLINMIAGYELIAETIPVETRQRIAKDLFHAAGKHIEGQSSQAIHNIQCWLATARMMAGLVCRDDTMRDRAVRDLRSNIAEGITDEGFWYEGSPSYHMFTLMALNPALLVARHNGIRLGDPDKLQAMYTALSKLVLPDYKVASINDCTPNLPLAGMTFALEAGCYLFENTDLVDQLAAIYAETKAHRDDPSPLRQRYALVYGPAVLPESPRFEPGSYALRDIGLAVLRHDGNTAIIKAGYPSTSHDHADRLNLILADPNRNWLIDLGTSGYGHPLYLEWYRHTAGHCTVMVDGKMQETGIQGRITQFVDTPDHAMTTVRCDDAYPGVLMSRTIAMTRGLVIDRFILRSDAPHTYTFTLHAPGSLSVTPIDSVNDDNSSEPSPLQHGPFTLQGVAGNVKQCRAIWIVNESPGTAMEGDPSLTALLAANTSVQIHHGSAAGIPGQVDHEVITLTARDNEVTFAAVYLAAAAPVNERIRALKVSGKSEINLEAKQAGFISLGGPSEEADLEIGGPRR
jgi:hypothetical protein